MRVPILDLSIVPFKEPVLMRDHKDRYFFADRKEVSTRPDGGRKYFGKECQKISVRSVQIKDGKPVIVNGQKQLENTMVPVFALKHVPVPHGLSSKTSPGAPVRGAVARSSYARALDDFANGWKPARKLFESRRTIQMWLTLEDPSRPPESKSWRASKRVPPDWLSETNDRSVLIFQSLDQRTPQETGINSRFAEMCGFRFLLLGFKGWWEWIDSKWVSVSPSRLVELKNRVGVNGVLFLSPDDQKLFELGFEGLPEAGAREAVVDGDRSVQ